MPQRKCCVPSCHSSLDNGLRTSHLHVVMENHEIKTEASTDDASAGMQYDTGESSSVQTHIKIEPEDSQCGEGKTVIATQSAVCEEYIYEVPVIKTESCLELGNTNSVHQYEYSTERISVQASIKTESDNPEYEDVKSGITTQSQICQDRAGCAERRESDASVFTERAGESPAAATAPKDIADDTQLFNCQFCNAKFRCISNLIRHNRKHTCTKLFCCDICNAKFKLSHNLKTHKRIHTGEKPFECEICDSRFTRATHLKGHKLIHTGNKPFECEICNVKFIQFNHLKQHLLIHTGERPFNCEICDGKFTRSNDLKQHKRIHTGEKPFACETCDAKFAKSCNLKRHKLVHEREKK